MFFKQLKFPSSIFGKVCGRKGKHITERKIAIRFGKIRRTVLVGFNKLNTNNKVLVNFGESYGQDKIKDAKIM